MIVVVWIDSGSPASAGRGRTLFVAKTFRPPKSTVFPYTTLFRSENKAVNDLPLAARDVMQLALLAPGVVNSTNNSRHQTERASRSEEHTSELQSRGHLVCRLLLENKIQNNPQTNSPKETH